LAGGGPLVFQRQSVLRRAATAREIQQVTSPSRERTGYEPSLSPVLRRGVPGSKETGCSQEGLQYRGTSPIRKRPPL